MKKKQTISITINEVANGFVVNAYWSQTNNCGPCAPSQGPYGNPSYVAMTFAEAQRVAKKIYEETKDLSE